MQKQILKQVQKMQQKMQMDLANAQKELEEATVEGVAGGGAIKAVVTGAQVLRSIKISKEVVDPQDVEMIEARILVAINDGLEKSRQLSSNRMGKVAAGLNLPPGLF